MKSEIASDRIFTIQSAESCFRLVYSANKLKSELTETELDKVEQAVLEAKKAFILDESRFLKQQLLDEGVLTDTLAAKL